MQGITGPMGPPGDPGKEGTPVCTSDSMSSPCLVTVQWLQKCGKNALSFQKTFIVKRQPYTYMHMLNMLICTNLFATGILQ